MNSNEKLYYPLDRGEFVKKTFCDTYQKLINKYNSNFEENKPELFTEQFLS